MKTDGEKMTWNGHHLVFKYPCGVCFFRDKDECPDCVEGIWVEDSPWYTGIPTEEGWYVCKIRDSDLYETQYFTNNNWDEKLFEKWQKIEEREN